MVVSTPVIFRFKCVASCEEINQPTEVYLKTGCIRQFFTTIIFDIAHQPNAELPQSKSIKILNAFLLYQPHSILHISYLLQQQHQSFALMYSFCEPDDYLCINKCVQRTCLNRLVVALHLHWIDKIGQTKVVSSVNIY